MKLLKQFLNIITTLLCLLAILSAVGLIAPRIAGYKPFSVISPSMTPTYKVGTLVYVKSEDFGDIRTGDVITFVINEQLQTATHRVVGIDEENRTFTTKGDANASNDGSPVFYENVVGVVRFAIPKIGYVSDFVSKPAGISACVAVLIAILLFETWLSVLEKKKEQRKAFWEEETVLPEFDFSFLEKEEDGADEPAELSADESE